MKKKVAIPIMLLIVLVGGVIWGWLGTVQKAKSNTCTCTIYGKICDTAHWPGTTVGVSHPSTCPVKLTWGYYDTHLDYKEEVTTVYPDSNGNFEGTTVLIAYGFYPTPPQITVDVAIGVPCDDLTHSGDNSYPPATRVLTLQDDYEGTFATFWATYTP